MLNKIYIKSLAKVIMKNRGKILIILLALIFIVATHLVCSSNPVEEKYRQKWYSVSFSGVWAKGEAFYTSEYAIKTNVTFYGENIFPAKLFSQNRLEKVCENYTRTKYKRVCVNNTLGYRQVIKKTCKRVGGVSGETICEEKSYNVTTRAKQICTREQYEEQYEKCKWVRIFKKRIGCIGPNGVYTNKIGFENLEYSLDNGDWEQVPCEKDRITVTGNSIRFRLNIPFECDIPIDHFDAIRVNRDLRSEG